MINAQDENADHVSHPHLDYQVFPQQDEKLCPSAPAHPQILSESTNLSLNSVLNVLHNLYSKKQLEFIQWGFPTGSISLVFRF